MIRVHLFSLLSESLFIFSFSFCPHFIHYISQTLVPLSAFCCCCCHCWLFPASQTNCILFSAALWGIHEVASHSRAHAYRHNCTEGLHSSFFVFIFHFFFLAKCFIWVCISLFYVLLTAEWHQQVSRLGQFGGYICYYQHPTFRRIPGSHSNLMLKFNCTNSLSLFISNLGWVWGLICCCSYGDILSVLHWKHNILYIWGSHWR